MGPAVSGDGIDGRRGPRSGGDRVSGEAPLASQLGDELADEITVLDVGVRHGTSQGA